MFPNILNNLLGTKFKVVTGYPGVNDLSLAMERGEADGRCGWTWSAAKAAKADWIRDKKIYIALQIATEKHPELTHIPLVTDLARTDMQRQALDLILSQQVDGPAVCRPAQGAASRASRRCVRPLRARSRIAEFLAEAEKHQLEIKPVDGQTLQGMVEGRMFKSPPDVIDAARKAIASR